MSKEETSYEDYKAILDSIYAGTSQADFAVFEGLLNKYQIRLRDKDGTAWEANYSIPTSVSNGLVLGIRYIKNDGTPTEDLFLFEQGKKIQPIYRGRVEGLLPEYEGTHRLPPNTKSP